MLMLEGPVLQWTSNSEAVFLCVLGYKQAKGALRYAVIVVWIVTLVRASFQFSGVLLASSAWICLVVGVAEATLRSLQQANIEE